MMLSDSELITYAWAVMTTANWEGKLQLANVSMKDRVKEFTNNSKSREENAFKRHYGVVSRYIKVYNIGKCRL